MSRRNFDLNARIEWLRKERLPKDRVARAHRMELEHLSRGSAVVKMPVTKNMTVMEGFANGGFLNVVGNIAGVYAAMSTIPEGHARLKTDSMYRTNPALPGHVLRAVAKVIHSSGRFVDVGVKIFDDTSKKLVGHGIFTYYKPKPKE